jgi:hypothetical protein
MASIVLHDLDGVLAVPYTMPEQAYPSIKGTLHALHARGDILCAASFNPRGYMMLRAWGVEHLFTAIRAGCNAPWSGETSEYADATHRTGMSKSAQIRDMLAHELRGWTWMSGEFYDDKQDNVDEVLGSNIPGLSTVHCVDERTGYVNEYS